MVGGADDGVVVEAEGCDDDVVVDGRLVAGAPPPLLLARMIRPYTMVVISSTTARPHSASTHGLRNHGEDVSDAPKSSSLFAPVLTPRVSKPSTSNGGLLPPTKLDPTDCRRSR